MATQVSVMTVYITRNGTTIPEKTNKSVLWLSILPLTASDYSRRTKSMLQLSVLPLTVSLFQTNWVDVTFNGGTIVDKLSQCYSWLYHP